MSLPVYVINGMKGKKGLLSNSSFFLIVIIRDHEISRGLLAVRSVHAFPYLFFFLEAHVCLEI